MFPEMGTRLPPFRPYGAWQLCGVARSFVPLPARVPNALCTLPLSRKRGSKYVRPCRGLTAPPSAAKTQNPSPYRHAKIATVSGHFCVAALG